MRFEGWPSQAIAWFEGLEQDNSRTYFTATRAVYEEAVRGPLLAIVDELHSEFGGEVKLFRPYRDVRFSPDKSPYKTQASAVLGDHSGAGPAYYLEISADGLMAASGYHQMARDQLQRYRQAVDDDRSGAELEEIVEDLEKSGYQVMGEALKSAPRGFARDHRRIRLLRHRGVTMMADLPPGRALSSRRALTHVAETWRAAGPLNQWLGVNVGPTREPPRSR